MLQFLYTGTLSPEFQAPATSMSSLVGLLLLGDKYEVPSFMGAVLKGVSERERAVSDSATLIEELPEVLERRPQVKQLVDEARAYVLKTFKDVTEKWASDEFKGLGLGVVKFLLQSEELEAESEEEIATKVAAWADNKPGTLTQLLPYIRFCCIRGEVLEKWMLFKHSNVGLIERALKVQAYSDERKRLEKGLVLCERSGVRKVHLELVENIRVGEEVVSVKTPSANWFGKTWSILVRKWIAAPEKEGEPERPPTVGLFLYFEEVVDGQETERSLTDKVQFRVYIRTWPDGLWALRATTLTTFSLEDGKGQKNWGFPDVLDLPWETAIKSSRFVGPTGAMVFKVVARRFSQAEN